MSVYESSQSAEALIEAAEAEWLQGGDFTRWAAGVIGDGRAIRAQRYSGGAWQPHIGWEVLDESSAARGRETLVLETERAREASAAASGAASEFPADAISLARNEAGDHIVSLSSRAELGWWERASGEVRDVSFGWRSWIGELSTYPSAWLVGLVGFVACCVAVWVWLVAF